MKHVRQKEYEDSFKRASLDSEIKDMSEEGMTKILVKKDRHTLVLPDDESRGKESW